MYETAIEVFIGFTAGNFIWQAFMKREWEIAAERSFFQAIALVAYLLAVAKH